MPQSLYQFRTIGANERILGTSKIYALVKKLGQVASLACRMTPSRGFVSGGAQNIKSLAEVAAFGEDVVRVERRDGKKTYSILSEQ